MKSLVFVGMALFTVSGVSASECTPTSYPCAPSSTDRQKAMDALRDVLQKHEAVRAARESWENATSRLDRDAEIELGVYERYLQAQNDMVAAGARALAVIREAYHIDPGIIIGAVKKPDGPGHSLDWAEGMSLWWNPVVDFEDEEYRKVTAPDGSIHYLHQPNLEAAGYTSIDGRVTVGYQELLSAYTEGNPGIVAATIFHEGLHFESLMLGWRDKEKEELGVYTVEADELDQFGITGDRAKLIVAERDKYRALVEEGVSTPFNAREDDDAAARDGYLEEEANRENLSRYYEDLKTKVEKTRDERLRKIQEEDRRRRQAEAVSYAEALVQRCGFTPIRTVDGAEIAGFNVPVRGYLTTYLIQNRMTWEEFQVALMMARACLDVTMVGIPAESVVPCGEGFAIAQKQWGDASFREHASFFIKPEAQRRCAEYLRGHWSKDIDARRFSSLLTKGHREFDREEDAELQRREQDGGGGSSGREPREPAAGGGSSGPSGRVPPAPGHCGFSSDGAFCR